jgi:hypothetical protein
MIPTVLLAGSFASTMTEVNHTTDLKGILKKCNKMWSSPALY